jgi:hypothetical protein
MIAFGADADIVEDSLQSDLNSGIRQTVGQILKLNVQNVVAMEI